MIDPTLHCSTFIAVQHSGTFNPNPGENIVVTRTFNSLLLSCMYVNNFNPCNDDLIVSENIDILRLIFWLNGSTLNINKNGIFVDTIFKHNHGNYISPNKCIIFRLKVIGILYINRTMTN